MFASRSRLVCRHTRVSLAVALVGISSLCLAVGAAARGSAGPVSVADPTISGVALVGRTVETSNGAWNPSVGLTYKYQWLRCQPSGGDDSSDKTCTTIAGADQQSYAIVNADIGKRLRARVTATSKGGKTQATSAATSVVATESGKPASSSPPTISGSPIVGSTLTASPGTWVGDGPIAYSYQWLRCDKDGNACQPRAGKTKAKYTVVDGDQGRTLRVRVVARNNRGSADAFSSATDEIQAKPSDGTITLPNGEKSVDAKQVPAEARLVVDQVQFSPNPLTSKNQTITVRIKVKDTRGNVVRNAVVFIRSTPKVTSGGDNSPTATDGWVQYSLVPENDISIRNGYSVQFYVKAYRAGDPTLGGIYGSRLVQLATRAG
jgi:hypothetical protein